jgi:hypothetical protein
MRIGSAIKDLATSDKRNDIFLASLSAKTIYVWDIAKAEVVKEVTTIMDFGGQRLALANSKDILVAGAYTRYGIASYNLIDGQILWHRKDLKGVQIIHIFPDDKAVFCGFSDKPGHLLDLDTGKTIGKLRSVRNIFFDLIQGWYVYDGLPDMNWVYPWYPYQAEIYNSQGKKQITIKQCSIFNVAFSLSYVAIADTLVLRFISRKDPDKVIIYNPPHGKSIRGLVYAPKYNVFIGVQKDYENHGPSVLISFDTSLDKPRIITEIKHSEEYAFCDYGQHLINSEGQYINTYTGEIERNFNFPQREYMN